MSALRTLPDASAGLGLRRPMLDALLAAPPGDFDLREVAPENWIGVGGRFGDALDALAARRPLLCHGLSLSLGSHDPLDHALLAQVRAFLDRHRVPLYSEHLSYCSAGGHLYDLMPLPFTEAAVRHVSDRIRAVQDALGRRIAVENISYYAAPFAAMPEADFINAVLDRADCDLLLDVNNIHVNSVNHRYDALGFLHSLPPARVVSMHVAGHYVEAPDLLVDTHGAPVVDPVWDLLQAAYRHCGPKPTVLERDFNLPPYPELAADVARIRALQQRAQADAAIATRQAHG